MAFVVPIDHFAAYAPVDAEFVVQGAASSDSLNHERLRALNVARRACATSDAGDPDGALRAYARYAQVASEASEALEEAEADAREAEASAPRWTSTLEDGTRKVVSSTGLYGEKCMAIFGIGACHRRSCAYALSERANADGELGEAAAERAATEARRAAGAFEYLSTKALPPLRGQLSADLRANELTASMADAFRLMSLGDAQSTAARRARERGVSWNLRARLHVAASAFYRDADAVLQNNRCDWNGVDIRVLASVLFMRRAHEAEAYLAHGERLREREHCGEAIAACKCAEEALKVCFRASREYSMWARYHDDISARHQTLAKTVTDENSVIFFQKVPPTTTLPEPAVVAKAIDFESSDAVKFSFFTN